MYVNSLIMFTVFRVWSPCRPFFHPHCSSQLFCSMWGFQFSCPAHAHASVHMHTHLFACIVCTQMILRIKNSLLCRFFLISKTLAYNEITHTHPCNSLPKNRGHQRLLFRVSHTHTLNLCTRFHLHTKL